MLVFLCTLTYNSHLRRPDNATVGALGDNVVECYAEFLVSLGLQQASPGADKSKRPRSKRGAGYNCHYGEDARKGIQGMI